MSSLKKAWERVRDFIILAGSVSKGRHKQGRWLTRIALAAAIVGLFGGRLLGLEVLPSRDANPPTAPRGIGLGKLRLFATDPTSLEKAENLDYDKLQAKAQVRPERLGVRRFQEGAAGEAGELTVRFLLENRSRKFFTLRFSTARRLEVTVRDADGQICFTSPTDPNASKEPGTTLLNPGDTLCYVEVLRAKDFSAPVRPGSYQVEVALCGYSKLRAKANFSLDP